MNRLRATEQTDFITKVVELGAVAADEATLAKLAEKVTAIVGNDFERIKPPKEARDGPVTFRTFAERWTNGELHRLFPDHIEEKASVQDDIERLEKHVYPHVEDVPLASFTREHADGVMAKLPSTLKKGTRRQVAHSASRGVFGGHQSDAPTARLAAEGTEGGAYSSSGRR